MCPKRTTIANRIEKERKIILRFFSFQKINARRKGSPVCPEKKRSFPVKMPLKASPLKNDEFITI